MKKTTKQLSACLLSICIVLSLVGCINNKSNTPSTPSGVDTKHHSFVEDSTEEVINVSAEAINEQAKFDTYLNEYFIDSMNSDTINLHYNLKDPAKYNIEHFDPTYGSISLEEIDNNGTLVNEYYDSLHSFDYNLLTKDQQLSYEVMDFYFTNEKKAIGLEYYSSILGTTSGIQGNLPITLCEYQFYTETDITDYLSLLNQTQAYFEEIMVYEKAQSEKGLFMSDSVLDEVIKQCTDFTSVVEENCLIVTFNTRIDNFPDISEEAKDAYKQQNKDSVLNNVIPAFNYLASELNTLRGTGTNNGGLANYPSGKEYYEYLVAYRTGSDKSIAQISNLLENKMSSTLSEIQSIAYLNWDAYDYFTTADCTLSDPLEILEFLNSSLDNYPTISDIPYTVKYVDESLEDTLSPAFYMIPPIDDTTGNVIYINNGSDYSENIDLLSTLAHEGYPGHLYQTNYFYSLNPNPVRSCFSYIGYVEGWAIYSELTSYDLYKFDKYDSEVSTIQKNYSEYNLAVSCRIDIGVNYEGWSLDDTKQFFKDNDLNEEACDSLYSYVIEEPANYLQYYVGYLEIMELQNYAKKELGSDFNLKGFNTAILNAGPAPFSSVRKSVEEYILTAK